MPSKPTKCHRLVLPSTSMASSKVPPHPSFSETTLCSEPSPQTHPDPVKYAWAAGLIDGDGCISAVVQTHIDRKTPSIRIRVIVSQNDHRTLDVLKGYLGERGALNGLRRQPYQNRPMYQLQYDGRHALAVINKVLPYLVRKRMEAEACLVLNVEGKLSTMPGPKGFPPDVLARRDYWVKRIRRMK